MMRRRLAASLLAFALGCGLAACAPAPDGADDLAALVEVAAEQAAAGDLSAAGTTIDALERRVVAQRDGGELDGPQAAAILETVALVRADLAALAPAPTPEPPAEEPAPTVGDDSGSETGVGTGDDDSGDNGEGKNGKGKDKGKGKESSEDGDEEE